MANEGSGAMSGKVLVTGASGHLGANLTRKLLERGVDVRVFVHPAMNNQGIEGLDVEIAHGDLRNPDEVAAAVQGCSRVFHTAAKISTGDPTPAEAREIFEINVNGARNVFRAALDEGVARVVMTGSFSAVGYHPDDLARESNEDVPFYPFDGWLPYTHTKVLAEHELLKAVNEGLDAVIATSTAIVGPHDFGPSRLGRVLCEFAERKLRAYVPGGFPFVSSYDIAEGHILAMEKGSTGNKYIFCTRFMTMDDLFDIYEEVTGARRPIKLPVGIVSKVVKAYYGVTKHFPQIPQRLTPFAIRILQMHRHADTTRAREELGWEPTDIKDAIRDQYEFFCKLGKIQPRRAIPSTGTRAQA